jgi:hypothetical protein
VTDSGPSGSAAAMAHHLRIDGSRRLRSAALKNRSSRKTEPEEHHEHEEHQRQPAA